MLERQEVKGVATLDTTGAEMLAKQTAVSTAELTEGVLVRVWQTLTLEEARKKVRTESLANSLTKKKKL
jgi:hypothetical protein